MIDNLSRPVRRLLALAILVAIPLLAWLLVVAPLVGMVSARQQAIADGSDRLQRLEAIAARIPALQEMDRLLNDRLTGEGDIWVERSDTVVSAKMESLVRSLVEQNGGTLASSSPLPSRTEQGFVLVQVRFKMSGPLDMVLKTLEGIEQAKPALMVTGFQIEVPANAGPATQPPQFNLDLDVLGYLRQEGS